MFTIAITRCPTDPRPRQIIRRTCSRFSASARSSRILWQNPHNRSKKLMRCNRHNAYQVPIASRRPAGYRQRLADVGRWSVIFAAACLVVLHVCPASAESSLLAARQVMSPQDQAALLVQRTIERLALGDAFDAKLRQRIWVGGREVTGIGHYEQSGGGTGRFSLEMTVHDGDARQSIRQISDGKLAWIRTQLGEAITLRRIDLGRIDEVHRELVRADAGSPARLGRQPVTAAATLTPPWMRVGGLVELVDQIARDYDLRVGKGTIDKKPVWIVRGAMNDQAWGRVTAAGGTLALCPYEVQLAIAAAGDAAGFGAGLPVQIEFYSQPSAEAPATAASKIDSAEPAAETPRSTTSDAPRGRLISLLEVYALRRIQPSPEERFRYKGDEPDVTFSNDTRIYLDRLTP